MKDTIYRGEAIKAIEDRRCWLTLASQRGDMGRVLWDEYYIKFEDAIDALMLISSADRPRGTYTNSEDDVEWYAIEATCNLCGKRWMGARNFCPNCGARMKGADDDCI